ncbi:MAG: type IV pilin protein [Colwellia sp.]|nr:type IV pilin protein [Colwellia sp.]
MKFISPKKREIFRINKLAKGSSIKGFTLMEVMIVVTIVGILVAVSYPVYSEFIWRSNRTEAQRELIRLANLQEQLFVDQRAYTETLTDLGVALTDGTYQIPRDQEKKWYTITSEVVDRTFVLTATAQGIQLKDTECLTLTISETGLKTPTEDCWE